jgi:DNA-binding LytR/AlgR family response regulator
VSSLPNPPIVVIMSDRQDYAYYAFRIQALDYRLKPITPEILRLVVARVHAYLQMKQALLKMQASENMLALAETLK